jgi:N-methylhydantoinase A
MMESYLGRLRDRLAQQGAACPIFLMHSGGGIVSIETAAPTPSASSSPAPPGAPSSPPTWPVATPSTGC